MSPIRLSLTDDHPIVLAGIKSLLETEPDIELVAVTSNGVQALAAIEAHRPDIAVIDISMPEMGGLSLARRISDQFPDTRIIALTVHEDPTYVQLLLQAGAKGYLLKRSAAHELLRAITAVSNGEVYLDPALADDEAPQPIPTTMVGGLEELSPRETEVLRLTALGFSSKKTAFQLGLSVKTVETYRARAVQKTALRTREEIVQFAVSQGWMDRPKG